MKLFLPFVLLFFVLFSSNVSAQDWTLVKNVEGISIYYRIDQCGSESAVFLKIKSIRDDMRVLKWEEVLAGSTTRRPEHLFKKVQERKLKIAPHSEVVGKCGAGTSNKLLILAAEAYPDINTYKGFDIQKYTVKNITLHTN